MTTIFTQVIESLDKIDVQYISGTTCWNYRRNKFGKNSNLRKKIELFFKHEPYIKEITVVVGRKGKTQHSSTELHIFDSTHKKELVGTVSACYRDYYVFTRSSIMI